MANKTGPKADGITPANDNNGAEHERQQRIDRTALTIARIVGRRIAREQFEARRAANDNRPGAARSGGDQADKD